MLILSMIVGVVLALILQENREIHIGAAIALGLLLGPLGALIVFFCEKKGSK